MNESELGIVKRIKKLKENDVFYVVITWALSVGIIYTIYNFLKEYPTWFLFSLIGLVLGLNSLVQYHFVKRLVKEEIEKGDITKITKPENEHFTQKGEDIIKKLVNTEQVLAGRNNDRMQLASIFCRDSVICIKNKEVRVNEKKLDDEVYREPLLIDIAGELMRAFKISRGVESFVMSHPYSGILSADMLEKQSGLSLIPVKKYKATYGVKKIHFYGKNVIIWTTEPEKGILKLIENIRKNGASVCGLISLVDGNNEVIEEIKREGIMYHPIIENDMIEPHGDE